MEADTRWKKSAGNLLLAAINLSSHAKKSYLRLARSDRRLFRRVEDELTRLGQEPQAGKALTGPLKEYRSLRISALRIVYYLDREEQVVRVLDIAQRGGVYR